MINLVRESSMLNQVNDWLTSIISSDNLEIFKFILKITPASLQKIYQFVKNQSLLNCDQSQSERMLIKSAETK